MSTWWQDIYIMFSQYSRAFGLFRPRSKWITDSTDATDFIFSRISFSLGFVSDFIAPNGAGLLQAKEKSVKIHAPWRTKIHYNKLKSVKEQIRRIRAIRDFLWTLVLVAKRWVHDNPGVISDYPHALPFFRMKYQWIKNVFTNVLSECKYIVYFLLKQEKWRFFTHIYVFFRVMGRKSPVYTGFLRNRIVLNHISLHPILPSMMRYP